MEQKLEDQTQNSENQQDQIEASLLDTQFFDTINMQLEQSNIEEFNETKHHLHIIGVVDSECRYFPSKKKDGNDIAFVFIKDEKKQLKQQFQITIQRNRFEKQSPTIFNNFKIMTQMLKQGSVADFKGYLGKGKNGVPCLYANYFRIIKVQYQNLAAFKWIQLYIHKIIDQETACVALQVSNDELQEIIKLGIEEKQDIWEKLGSSDMGRHSKTENKFKNRLVQVTRILQQMPINKCKQRAPKFPREYYQCIDYYEAKLKDQYEEQFIDQNDDIVLQNQDELQRLQQNLPNIQDQRRLKYINNKKAPQVQWFLTQIKNLQEKTQKQFKHYVDIGGGRGDLALAIAQAYPNSFVTVIDINEQSLEGGREIAQKYNIQNIKFVMEDAEKLEQNKENPFDIAVGLHACGGLSDILLNFACQNQMAFFVCTCCFNSLYQIVPKEYQQIQMSQYKNKEKDRQLLGRFSEIHEAYHVSERCMKIVNTIRLNTVQKIVKSKNFMVDMLRFPKRYSPKNFVLQGYWKPIETTNNDTYIQN